MPVSVTQTDAKLALEHLFERLAADVALRLDPPPECSFGWREDWKQINQGTGGANRIVMLPGDPGGKVGDLQKPSGPGRNPNPLAAMAELATILLWAYDATDPTSALLQWRAARRLHDVVIASCIRTYRGRWKQVGKQWVRPELERPFGAEMQIVFAVEAMVPDDLVTQAAAGSITTIGLPGSC